MGEYVPLPPMDETELSDRERLVGHPSARNTARLLATIDARDARIAELEEERDEARAEALREIPRLTRELREAQAEVAQAVTGLGDLLPGPEVPALLHESVRQVAAEVARLRARIAQIAGDTGLDAEL
jgi:multidrug resistance efflux pump